MDLKVEMIIHIRQQTIMTMTRFSMDLGVVAQNLTTGKKNLKLWNLALISLPIKIVRKPPTLQIGQILLKIRPQVKGKS